MCEWVQRWFGFWDCPPYGVTPYPRIERFLVAEEDRPRDREAISHYLRGGRPIYFSNGHSVADPVTGRLKSGILAIRTDGVWLWRSDLAEYIVTYPLVIPEEFVAHIRGRNYEQVKPGDEICEDIQWPPPIRHGSIMYWCEEVIAPPANIETWDRKWYGFWASPGARNTGLPNINEFITRPDRWPDLDQVCAYLEGARRLHGPMQNQYVDPVTGQRAFGDLATFTDGEWVWKGTLAVLLRKYDLDLPSKLLERVRQAHYVPPEVSDEVVASLDYPPCDYPHDPDFTNELHAWAEADVRSM